MTSRLPDAIIYDWDNTLVDSFALLYAANNHVRAVFDKPLLTPDEARRQIRLSAKDAFPKIFGDDWEKARDVYLDYVRAHHLDDLVFMPGADELVGFAQFMKIPQGVFSNKTNTILRAEVEKFSKFSAFSSVIGSGDFEGAGKPSPDGLLFTAGQMNLSKSLFNNVWYVGDTENDILTARACGMVSVFIENDSMTDMEEIALMAPQYQFKTCLQCLAHLTTLG